MGDRLKIHRIAATTSPDVFSQVLARQCVTKILKSGTFEHGLQRGKLIRYSYNAGEMILPRRDTEEWLRWISDTAVLMVELPEDALQAVAQTTGADRVEIECTP